MATYPTIKMHDLLDYLDAARVDALERTADDPRWREAVATGYDRLLHFDAVQYNHDNHTMLVPSATSDTHYHANGACQCEAYHHGQPCHHRAMARLVRRAVERQQAAAAPAPSAGAAPLLRPSRLTDDLFKDESLDPRPRGGCAQDGEWARGRADGKEAYEQDPAFAARKLEVMQRRAYTDTYAAGWVRGYEAGKAYAEMDELFA
jgi:hypothetical protein